MENEKLSTEDIVKEYKEDVCRLLKYVPWLESKAGQQVADTYRDNDITKTSMTFPVYDGTLLNFVKELKGTKLMERNFAYAYSKYRMRNSSDELQMIQRAKITDIFLLRGILSRYVMKGMTKSAIWSEGVENRVFLEALLKLRELIEFYEGPLN